jgi:hypothetical protein
MNAAFKRREAEAAAAERARVIAYLRGYAIERQNEFGEWVSLNAAADAIEDLAHHEGEAE